MQNNKLYREAKSDISQSRDTTKLEGKNGKLREDGIFCILHD